MHPIPTIDWMSAFAWLAFYPHGARRMFVPLPGAEGETPNRGRERCVISQEKNGWFQSLCERHSICADLKDGQSLAVHALVEIVPCALHKLLHQHSKEVLLLWGYYFQPLDAASVQVLRVWQLSRPRDVHVVRRRLNRNDLPGSIWARLGQAGVIHPAEDFFIDMQATSSLHGVAQTQDVAAVLASLGFAENEFDTFPALCIPAPIGHLILARAWSELLLLGRWARVFPDWPPADWVQDVRGKRHHHGNHSLSVHSLETLARDLRRWSIPLLANLPDDDEGETVMKLERHVAYLDAVVAGTRKADADKDESRKHVIQCLLLSRRLRHQGQLAPTVQKAVGLLPQSLRELAGTCVTEGWLQIPSASSLQRFQLTFDVALMLLRRRDMAADVIRYGFADSSPQGKRDWFIAKVHSIKRADLVSVMHSVRSLVSDAAQQIVLDDDAPMLGDAVMDRALLADHICSSIQSATLPPVALGLGKTSVEDKAAALLYALFLETGWEHLLGALHTFASFTTDMGQS